MGPGSYGVRTMGDLDDDTDGYSTHAYPTMGDIDWDAPQAGESFYTDGTSSGRGVGTATADPIDNSNAAIVVRSGGTGTPAPGTPAPHASSGGGGGRGGLAAPAPALVAPGLFGDLFGAQTDTIVLAAGLLVIGGLVYLTVTHHKKGPTRRRAARR